MGPPRALARPLGVAAGALRVAAAAQALSDHTVKPERVIVGRVSGGGNDIQARLFAHKLSESFGRSLVV